MLPLYEAIQKDTQEGLKICLRLFDLLQKNGRESHRYEKKTVFDILGVVYNCTVSNLNQKTAEMTINSCLLNRAVVTL